MITRRKALACAAVAPLAIAPLAAVAETPLELSIRELSEVCATTADLDERCGAVGRVMIELCDEERRTQRAA
jgi:hypothetical protein